jgi:soluble lytic murein transglycosylase
VWQQATNVLERSEIPGEAGEDRAGGSAEGANRGGADEPGAAVLPLVSQPMANRTAALSALAQKSSDLDRHRARYLLATDLIAQGQAVAAIDLLSGLETEYGALAPYVLFKRGQAQKAAQQVEAAQQTWVTLLKNYPGHPATAGALYELGKADANAHNQLLQSVPTHPQSVKVAMQRLQQKNNKAPTAENTPAAPKATSVPKPAVGAATKSTATASTATASTASTASTATSGPVPAATPSPVLTDKGLLLVVADSGLHDPNYEGFLDQLVTRYGAGLTPQQWQTVAFGYWEIQRYGKAADAYAKAPGTPLTRYRAARGAQLDQRRDVAIERYRQLAQAFPAAPETATGLLKLADSLPSQAALGVLDQVVAGFPDRAGEALLKKVDLLEKLNSKTSADQTRQLILSSYSASEAAAELRMKEMKRFGEAGNYATAVKWAQELIKANPTSELAAEAGFWSGKWSLQLNPAAAPRQAFEQVIAQHPESYFAWRSAVHLGWNVGDFDDVRSHNPSVVLPHRRFPLPAGSATLQELYLLGQDQDAWALWQQEFKNKQNPTVAEQFTDGILRLGIGDNLDAIFMLTSLNWRDLPEEKAQVQALRQQDSYWQGVYPFPFANIIETWAIQRQLNPLLVTALIRQESRFEPKIRSVVGATGLMQVMPDTADWIVGQTGEAKANLEDPTDSVRLGTWYLDYTHREYNNNSLFAVASYNAGPGNVAEWISEGGYRHADEFVEKIPFPETKGYVEAVFGGYWNYLRLYNPEIAAQVAKYQKN